jgi:hypothetical protein
MEKRTKNWKGDEDHETIFAENNRFDGCAEAQTAQDPAEPGTHHRGSISGRVPEDFESDRGMSCIDENVGQRFFAYGWRRWLR